MFVPGRFNKHTSILSIETTCKWVGPVSVADDVEYAASVESKHN